MVKRLTVLTLITALGNGLPESHLHTLIGAKTKQIMEMVHRLGYSSTGVVNGSVMDIKPTSKNSLLNSRKCQEQYLFPRLSVIVLLYLRLRALIRTHGRIRPTTMR